MTVVIKALILTLDKATVLRSD